MSAPKIEQSQIEKWQNDCQYIEDLVNSCPALTDADSLHRWYQEVHGWLVYFAQVNAEAELLYSIAVARVLDSGSVSQTAEKYTKGSSTMLSLYLTGKLSDEYRIFQRVKNLSKVMERILSDMQTQLVSLRDADRRDNMTAQNQRQQPQPARGNNPAVTDNTGWPKEQSAR